MPDERKPDLEPRPHTLQIFDQELERLRELILDLGEAAREQLSAAGGLLVSRDPERARQVVQDDDKADRLANQVDQLVVRLLALRQPLAGDLRAIVAALKMAADLERIADYATSVAKHAPDLDALLLEDPVALVARMAQVGEEMLTQALRSYRDRDPGRAASVKDRDDEMDRLYHELLGVLQRHLASRPAQAPAFTSLLYMGRALERVGDHVTNLCDQIRFQEQGRL
jgi:phosphate transport system protein